MKRTGASARAVLLCAALVGSGVAARADTKLSLEPRLTLGAGYDDNLFLDANPSGALPSQIRSDAIFDIEPSLAGQVTAARNTFTLSADFLERLTLSNGDLRDVTALAGWRSPELGPLRLRATGLFEHYQATAFPEDTFDKGGGEAAITVAAGIHVGIFALYRLAARSYSDPSRAGQLDLEQRASGGLALHLHPRVDASLGYTFLHIGSNNPTAVLDRHRGDVALTVRPTSWLALFAAYGLAWQHLPDGELPSPSAAANAAGPRSDLQHEVGLTVITRPLAWLDLFARYDWIASFSTAATGAWQRDQVLAGVSLHYDLVHRIVRVPPLLPTVRAHLVTFRYRGAATRVAVVGDWNGWDPTAQPLASRGAQRYEATYTLPPGRHEYAFSVDGVLQAPPDAQGYVPDGFGGKNGIVEVP